MAKMELANAHVLITGGTAGIGLALARVLARQRAHVLVCGRDEDRVAAARQEGLSAITADVATPEGRADLLREIRRTGCLDVLVNNAGVQTLMDLVHPPHPGVVGAEISVNFEAPIRLTLDALPLLLRRRPGHPLATVVNVTSGLALAPKRSAAIYCAAKAGLHSFSIALRYQLESTPVRVLEVLPPLVDTAMTAGRGRKKMKAQRCAEEIVRAMKGEATEAAIGKTKLLRLLLRLAPSLGLRATKNS